MKTLASTYATEFYLDGELLFQEAFINLNWGKGSIVSFDGEDYEIQNFFEIGEDAARVNVTLLTEW